MTSWYACGVGWRRHSHISHPSSPATTTTAGTDGWDFGHIIWGGSSGHSTSPGVSVMGWVASRCHCQCIENARRSTLAANFCGFNNDANNNCSAVCCYDIPIGPSVNNIMMDTPTVFNMGGFSFRWLRIWELLYNKRTGATIWWWCWWGWPQNKKVQEFALHLPTDAAVIIFSNIFYKLLILQLSGF